MELIFGEMCLSELHLYMHNRHPQHHGRNGRMVLKWSLELRAEDGVAVNPEELTAASQQLWTPPPRSFLQGSDVSEGTLAGENTYGNNYCKDNKQC
jgi:hypothetical protein